MKLKNNKGYVGIDASIAVLVLLIIVPTIAGLIYNVNKSNNLIDRKSEAISIAVNTIETIKGIGVSSFNADSFDETIIVTRLNNIYTEEINSHLNSDEKTVTTETDGTKTIDGLILEKGENTYTIKIQIQDYANTQAAQDRENATGVEVKSECVKQIKVIVGFRTGKQQKDIELNTVISEKE